MERTLEMDVIYNAIFVTYTEIPVAEVVQYLGSTEVSVNTDLRIEVLDIKLSYPEFTVKAVVEQVIEHVGGEIEVLGFKVLSHTRDKITCKVAIKELGTKVYVEG